MPQNQAVIIVRVLIVNKFYYNRGGDCVVAISLAKELQNRGYDVAVFTMDYPENIKGDSIFTAPEVSFKGGIKGKLQFVGRMLGGAGVASSFKEVLKKFNPDIVHLHNIHSYLSPVVAQIAKAKGCRVFWTLHDSKLACPAYACLNHGKVCELCFKDKTQVVRQRCVKGNLAASILAYIEALRWNKSVLVRSVDKFICPSDFMRQQMIKAGFPADKFTTICNFIDPVKLETLSQKDCTDKQDYYTYIGRLSEEKGIETLLKVAQELPYKLKVAGNGPQGEYLRSKYTADNIEYLGQLDAFAVSSLLEHARLLVIPSECYENNPLSVIESLCAGTPVIGARIGGIPELISPDSGLTYTSGDCQDLSKCITSAMEHGVYDYAAIADRARRSFSADAHFEKLEKLYNQNF